MVVKRTHSAANVAPALKRLIEQVNTAYPDRKKASDGIWPSPAHSKLNPNSDHEAGNALDITSDLGAGKDVSSVVSAIVRSRDSRISYVIHDRRIWSPLRGWRNYSGSNPHTKHAHFSIKESKRKEAHAWTIKMAKKYPGYVLKPNSKRNKADDVLWVQKRLNVHGWKVKVDGIYGKLTGNAVAGFRKQQGWSVKPYVGPLTWKALGKGK